MGRRNSKKPSLTDVKAHPPDDQKGMAYDLKSRPPDINDKLSLLKLFVDKLTVRIRKTGAQWNTYSYNRKEKNGNGTYVMDNVELIAVYNAGISTLRTVDMLWNKALDIKIQITDADKVLSSSQRIHLYELEKRIMIQENNLKTLEDMYCNADKEHFAAITYADSNIVEQVFEEVK